MRAGPAPIPESVAPALEQVGPPPTEDEAKQFGFKLEQAIRERDGAKAEGMLRTRDLLLRCISDLGLTEEGIQACKQGIEDSVKRASFSLQLLQNAENGGTYKFLRVHTVDGRQRVLFRFIVGNGAIGYLDFIVARLPDGTIGMEDVYIVSSGELYSQTRRRLFIPIAAQANGAPNISKEDKELVEYGPKLTAIRRSFRMGQFAEGIAKYGELPQSLRENKTILLSQIHSLSAQGRATEAEYIEALGKFRSLYPKDACIDLLSIDYYFAKKDLDSALKAINRVDESVGGDPQLAAMRANTYLEMKRFDDARQQVNAALKVEPDLERAYWCGISITLHEMKHAETLEWLKKAVQNCKTAIPE